MQVVKMGGNQLAQRPFLKQLSEVMGHLGPGQVVVHGGGAGTSDLCRRLGIEPRFLDGLRVTDAETLDITVMGLVGQASLQIVQSLVRAEVPALGLCGADARLVTARKLVQPEGAPGGVGKHGPVDGSRRLGRVGGGFGPGVAPGCLCGSLH